MIRFDSLKDLHDKLAEIELLKNKIQLCNDEIFTRISCLKSN